MAKKKKNRYYLYTLKSLCVETILLTSAKWLSVP